MLAAWPRSGTPIFDTSPSRAGTIFYVDLIAYANKANAAGLKVFFGVLLLLVLGAGFYIIRNRRKFFSYQGDVNDSYASANLRM